MASVRGSWEGGGALTVKPGTLDSGWDGEAAAELKRTKLTSGVIDEGSSVRDPSLLLSPPLVSSFDHKVKVFVRRCGSGVTPSSTCCLCFSSYIMEPLVSSSLSSPHDEVLASRIEAQHFGTSEINKRGKKGRIKC